MLLKGKNAIVTGCLSGIGRATMELFARHGADVWACCQHADDDWNAHAAELEKRHGTKITPVCFDLMKEDQVKAGGKSILSEKKPVDVLVNVAGMTEDALLHMTTMEQLKRVFEVNFFSQILLTQVVTRPMLKRKAGSIVNISSISALDGNPGQLAYASSKAALIGATKTMSAELAPHGIRVNAVAPGVIKTAMTDKLPPETVQRLLAPGDIKHPGLPEDVGNLIVFLASDMSSYITGQVIRIDGGIG